MGGCSHQPRTPGRETLGKREGRSREPLRERGPPAPCCDPLASAAVSGCICLVLRLPVCSPLLQQPQGSHWRVKTWTLRSGTGLRHPCHLSAAGLYLTQPSVEQPHLHPVWNVPELQVQTARASPVLPLSCAKAMPHVTCPEGSLLLPHPSQNPRSLHFSGGGKGGLTPLSPCPAAILRTNRSEPITPTPTFVQPRPLQATPGHL